MLAYLTLLLLQINARLFEQEGHLNGSKIIEINMDNESTKILDSFSTYFDFSFDFPTIITIFLNNRTTNSSTTLLINKQETKIGITLCQDLQLSIQNILIQLDPLSQYMQTIYKYKLIVTSNQNNNQQIIRNQLQVGFTKNMQNVSYFYNMSYETSGIYEIVVDFLSGSGTINLTTCQQENCFSQLNQNRILLNYSQVQCIHIDNYYFIDICNHNLIVSTNSSSQFILSFKYYTTQQISSIKPNSITNIDLINQEAFLTLTNLSSLNFLYFNEKIDSIFYCGDQRSSQTNDVILINHQLCNPFYDLDQNFYLQYQSRNITIQYINSITSIVINSKHRVIQEADSYQFFCIETIFQEFIFDIYVYDYELLVQIYFSNSTQYPNQYENQFELIESNYKQLQIGNQNKLYVGIKTKEKYLQYDISITETISQYLNLYQELSFSYCKTCQKEFKYQQSSKGLLFIHISLQQELNKISSFNLQFIGQGDILTPNITKTFFYIRYSYEVQGNNIYTILTKSQLQQEVKVLITDMRYLNIRINQLLLLPDFCDEIFKINKNQENLFYFYFSENYDGITVSNFLGSVNYSKIAENFYEARFHNNKREDTFTYFTITASFETIKFIVFEKDFQDIIVISENIFLSELEYEVEENKIVFSTTIINCTNIICHKLNIDYPIYILEITFLNGTSQQFSNFLLFTEKYKITLNQFELGSFSQIKHCQMIFVKTFDEKSFVFKSKIYHLDLKAETQIQQDSPKLFGDFIKIIYIILILVFLYLVLMITCQKQVKKLFKYNTYRKIDNSKQNVYQNEGRYEDQSELMQQME